MKTPSLRLKKIFPVRPCTNIVFLSLLLLGLTACARSHHKHPKRPPIICEFFPTTNSGDFSYTERAQEVWVDRYIGTGETATVPDAFAGRPVTCIQASAFNSAKHLTSIHLSSNLTIIGDYAFSDCARLTNLCIPAGVRSIGSGAFTSCTSLTRMVIPDSVTNLGGSFLGGGVFENCSNLNSVQISTNIMRIGSRTFYGCPNLSSNLIPKNIEIFSEWPAGFFNEIMIHPAAPKL